MNMEMPRGAIPVSRSQLAAAEPFRPDARAEVFVPSGPFPTPNQELAAARPFKPSSPAPESFFAWPTQPFAKLAELGSSLWAEEAFAKACASPSVALPPEVVEQAQRQCGSANFAQYMQISGFQLDGTTYLDGPFLSLDWTDRNALHSAIASSGSVKIAVASEALTSPRPSGKSGWILYNLPPAQPAELCAGLCGYGTLAFLVQVFRDHGISFDPPSGVPAELCYLIFLSGSLGIIDEQSLRNITGEAWIRNPTTLVRKPPG